MSRFEVSGFDDLMSDLESISRAEIAEAMLKSGEKVLKPRVENAAAAYKESGDMAGSIKSTGVKKNESGHYLVVRPTGKDHKGVRNMDKMAYLEFGTSKQSPKFVLSRAVKSSEAEVLKAMEQAFEKAMDKGGL